MKSKTLCNAFSFFFGFANVSCFENKLSWELPSRLGISTTSQKYETQITFYTISQTGQQQRRTCKHSQQENENWKHNLRFQSVPCSVRFGVYVREIWDQIIFLKTWPINRPQWLRDNKQCTWIWIIPATTRGNIVLWAEQLLLNDARD